MKKQQLLSIVILAAPSAAAHISPMNPSGAENNIIRPPDWKFEPNQSPYLAMVVSSGCDVNGDVHQFACQHYQSDPYQRFATHTKWISCDAIPHSSSCSVTSIPTPLRLPANGNPKGTPLP